MRNVGIGRGVAVLGFSALVMTSGACGVEQGAACKAFVACVEEFDTLHNTDTNVDRFLPDGACWNGQKGADVCETACRRGTVLLHQQDNRLTCKTVGEGAL